MFKRFVLSVVAFLGLAVMSMGQGMPQIANDPATRVGKLDNGMTYYIRHNDKPEQRAEFYLATNAGAVLETPDQDGLAHFLEHMCFNGTKNFPDKNLLNWLESIGASFGGNVNAGTGIDQTTYMLTNIPLIRPTVVDSCILIMHDYSHFVECDPAEIDAERGVILEEKRVRNDASWRLREALFEKLFQGSKYATTTIIGSEENLKTFKPQSLKDFYHTWYRPDLQALIVVGDIDVDEVEAKIKTTFADIPAQENPTPKPVHAIPNNAEPITMVFTDPELTTNGIDVWFKSEPLPFEMRSSFQGVMIDIVKNLISRVINERLSDLVADPQAPFLNLNFGFAPLINTCEASVISASQKEGKALESLETMLIELKKAQLYGFSEAEVKRAKDELLSVYDANAKAASTRKNAQFVQPMIQNFFFGDPYMTPEDALQIVQFLLPNIPTEVLNQVIAQLVTKDNMVITAYESDREGLIHPTEEQLLEVIKTVDAMDIAPAEGEEIPEQFLDPAKLKGSKASKAKAGLYGSSVYTLRNGARVVLLPSDREKNKVSFSLIKKGGTSLLAKEDLPSFDDSVFGLYLANSGVASFPKTTVSKMLSGKQLSVNPDISQFSHSIKGNTTSDDLETALQLCYLYFSAPRFDESEYRQGIELLENQLPMLEQSPNYVFQKEMYNTIYAGDRISVIDGEKLSKANLATLKKGYEMLFNDAAGATFYMVGDFELEEALALVEKYIGSIKKGKKAQNYVDHGPVFASGNIINDFNTPMQNPMTSIMTFYTMQAPYTVEADVNVAALSYILRMQYTATLREGEGGTYSPIVGGGASDAPSNARYIQISVDTNEEIQQKMRDIIHEVFNTMASSGPNAEEFDKALKNLEKKIPEDQLRNSYWLSALKSYDWYGYDYVSEYEQAVKALTAQKVQQAAQDFLQTANPIEVVMHPAAQ